MGLMVICNDVRTDTMLLGFSACAVWQLAEYLEFNRWRNLFAAFFFIGLAMLAKGPIGLVMRLLQRVHTCSRLNGAAFFAGNGWQGWYSLLWYWPRCAGDCGNSLTCIRKNSVNDRHGVSGLRFFFWSKVLAVSPGKMYGKTTPPGFYFLHVYLWAFLPWCLLLPGAIWR